MTVVLRGDALNLPLQDESVDLIVTSPPYFALRSYTDSGEHYEGQIGSEATPQDFLEALWKATEEMKRVLKPSGSIFVNLGDKYAGTGGANGNTGLGLSDDAKDAPVDARRAPRNNTRQTSNAVFDPIHEGNGVGRQQVVGRTKGYVGVRPKSLLGLPWRYAIGCIDRLGLILRAEIVWSKPNGLPESVKDRVRRSHEQWFHLTKEGRYFADVDAVRIPHEDLPRMLARNERAGRAMREGRTTAGTDMRPHTFALEQAAHPGGKLPPSVWSIATEPLTVPAHVAVEHFAAFPQEWPRRFIVGWAPEGGVVLDPFGGTGTVAMVARSLGRIGISVDLSHDYCRLARWRVFESGHAAKSIARTARERQGAML